MTISHKPIIQHIPSFLAYCANEGLSQKTHENYERYLKKFITWINEEKKETLLPHELTADYVLRYNSFLTNFRDKNGKALKPATQHYYLIALRALLSYFEAKGVLSLPPSRVKLEKGVKSDNKSSLKPLTLRQIDSLLAIPNAKTFISLRDRAILGPHY